LTKAPNLVTPMGFEPMNPP